MTPCGDTEGDENCIAAIEALFKAYGSLRYGEEVTQLEHALQCGFLAQESGAAPALILAAVLHDIGHMLHPDAAAAVAADQNDAHERLGAQALSKWFGRSVSEPVRLHVQAKRWLCLRHQDYWEQLSPLSKRTLELQGGAMTAPEADEFERLPYSREALQLRRWDDLAKRADHPTPSLSHYLGLARGLLQS